MSVVLPPPRRMTAESAAPKEMLFVIDRSGSQAGAPLEKAKETMRWILDHLNPDDTFQVIDFGSTSRQLFPAPRFATAYSRRRARAYIDALQADGGTMMADAVRRACATPADGRRAGRDAGRRPLRGDIRRGERAGRGRGDGRRGGPEVPRAPLRWHAARNPCAARTGARPHAGAVPDRSLAARSRPAAPPRSRTRCAGGDGVHRRLGAGGDELADASSAAVRDLERAGLVIESVQDRRVRGFVALDHLAVLADLPVVTRVEGRAHAAGWGRGSGTRAGTRDASAMACEPPRRAIENRSALWWASPQGSRRLRRREGLVPPPRR